MISLIDYFLEVVELDESDSLNLVLIVTILTTARSERQERYILCITSFMTLVIDCLQFDSDV